MNDETGAAAAAISVSELNRRARALLEQGLERVWVLGELSNLARPASGHLYFSLKDETAQIRCAWFRQRQRGPSLGLKNGDRMLAFGRVSIYEARGDYQLIVEQLEEAGEGALRRQFEVLKKKLAAEGLFAAERRKPLPALPRAVGVITSPSGAAVRDILSVLRRRFPSVPVVIYPSAVQGEGAARELLSALQLAIRREDCDVLILARGGGSLEDLWAFNDEALARAIAACPIPVVSAVGHEIDFTIADFVADLRAPTPSGAAELVVPDRAEWRRVLEGHRARIVSLVRRALEDRSQRFDWIGRRLARASPAATLRRQQDWLVNLRQVLYGAMRHDLMLRSRRLQLAASRLLRQSPALRVERAMRRLGDLERRQRAAMDRALADRRARQQLADRALRSVGPQATLDRGYAIVTDPASGRVLRAASELAPGDRIEARLARGSLGARVESVSED